jgi:KaiC/GvpD/RAD55 family RecA-like ATPase
MMRRRELNERSPLRVLEQSIHGGLGAGKIGAVVARHGVGKTAFLVGVALDDLMRGRQVLHVSLDQQVDRVRNYYDEIFHEIVHARSLEDVWKVRLEMERNRRIHSYVGNTFSVDRIPETIEFLRTHTDFVPSAIIIDGFDFEAATREQLQRVREIAGEIGAEIWMTAVTHRESERDERGVPEPLAGHVESLDVILSMAHDGKTIRIGLLKDHDNPDVSELKLALDPTTMLLVKE